jgi:prepilin-type N-terminal cleavage/methylation domain-containing protein
MKMRKGFSLIEIGIVMVVIGLIIAAVMKGKDVIKGAEVKEWSQTFAAKWVNIADAHYDKVGYNIGGAEGTMYVTTALDGFNNNGVDMGCEKIKDYVQNAGINIEKTIKQSNGDSCTMRVAGEYTDEVTVGVGFGTYRINRAGDYNLTRNIVLFGGVPGDMAASFDKLIDGVSNGKTGKVIAIEQYDDQAALTGGLVSKAAGNTKYVMLDNANFGALSYYDYNSTDETKSFDTVKLIEEGATGAGLDLQDYDGAAIESGALYTIGVILDH